MSQGCNMIIPILQMRTLRVRDIHALCLNCSSLSPSTDSCFGNKNSSFRLQPKRCFFQEAFPLLTPQNLVGSSLCCPTVLYGFVPVMAFMYCAVIDCFRICFPHQTLNSSRAEGKVCIANILNSYTRQDPWHVAGDQQVHGRK